MKNNISSVNYVCDGRLVQVNVPNSKVIMLSDVMQGSSVKDRGEFLSAVERTLAMDFTDYYDKFDSKYGVPYGKIEMTNVGFADGTSIVYSGKDLSFAHDDNKFCIRQIALGILRSFAISESTEGAKNNIGVDMTVYNSYISEKTWLYIENIVNSVIDYKYVAVDTIGMKISFNADVPNQAYCKGIYLLFSEIIALGEGRAVPLYVLVSELPQVEKFGYGTSDSLKKVRMALENLRYDCQIFLA